MFQIRTGLSIKWLAENLRGFSLSKGFPFGVSTILQKPKWCDDFEGWPQKTV